MFCGQGEIPAMYAVSVITIYKPGVGGRRSLWGISGC